MIQFAGLDWLWLALGALGFWLSAAIPMWMHGRACAADAYESGWFDRNERKPLRPYFAGWRALLGGRHSRLRLWAEWRWPRVYLPPGPELAPEREWTEIKGAWRLEETRMISDGRDEWGPGTTATWRPEDTADWMAPEARAELALWVQGQMLVKS